MVPAVQAVPVWQLAALMRLVVEALGPEAKEVARSAQEGPAQVPKVPQEAAAAMGPAEWAPDGEVSAQAAACTWAAPA